LPPRLFQKHWQHRSILIETCGSSETSMETRATDHDRRQELLQEYGQSTLYSKCFFVVGFPMNLSCSLSEHEPHAIMHAIIPRILHETMHETMHETIRANIKRCYFSDSIICLPDRLDFPLPAIQSILLSWLAIVPGHGQLKGVGIIGGRDQTSHEDLPLGLPCLNLL
jgi:hypothetical protein